MIRGYQGTLEYRVLFPEGGRHVGDQRVPGDAGGGDQRVPGDR